MQGSPRMKRIVKFVLRSILTKRQIFGLFCITFASFKNDRTLKAFLCAFFDFINLYPSIFNNGVSNRRLLGVNWSLSQLSLDKGRVTPWNSCRASSSQIIICSSHILPTNNFESPIDLTWLLISRRKLERKSNRTHTDAGRT